MLITIDKELEILKSTILSIIPAEKIILFGSYSNGTQNEDSDIDLYVIMKDETLMREIEASKLIRRAMRYKINMPLDLLVGRKSNFEKRSVGLTMENDILTGGKVIYV